MTMLHFISSFILFILYSFTLGQNINSSNNASSVTTLIEDIFDIPGETTLVMNTFGQAGGNTGDVVGNCKCLPFDQCESAFLRIRNKEACRMSNDYLCCSLNNQYQTESSTRITRNTSLTCGRHNPYGVGFLLDVEPHESKNGEFPWMVSILSEEYYIDEHFIKQKVNVFLCGGSLIHPKIVLTSASCINESKSHFVRAGDWDTQTLDHLYPHQDRKVQTVIFHDRFNPKNHANDIALLFLESEVEITDNVRTVCLNKIDFKHLDMSNCVLNGWGKNRLNGEYSTILKKIDLTVLERAQCLTTIRRSSRGRGNKKLNKTLMCAINDSDGNFCDGDEGGPLVCPHITDNAYYQVGIASKHLNCGENKLPSLFTNVSLFQTWIENKVRFKQLSL